MGDDGVDEVADEVTGELAGQIASKFADEAADVMIGSADALPCADRVPTDGANCRGCSSAMPSDRGLGLMESCKLTRDIGTQTSGESDLPRFGALDEVKPLRPACLFFDYDENRLQWGAD